MERRPVPRGVALFHVADVQTVRQVAFCACPRSRRPFRALRVCFGGCRGHGRRWRAGRDRASAGAAWRSQGGTTAKDEDPKLLSDRGAPDGHVAPGLRRSLFALCFARRAPFIEPAGRVCQLLGNLPEKLCRVFFRLRRQVFFDKSPQPAEFLIQLAPHLFKFVHDSPAFLALRKPNGNSGIIETRKMTRKEARWQFPISGRGVWSAGSESQDFQAAKAISRAPNFAPLAVLLSASTPAVATNAAPISPFRWPLPARSFPVFWATAKRRPPPLFWSRTSSCSP